MMFQTDIEVMAGMAFYRFELTAPPSEREMLRDYFRLWFSEKHPVRNLAERLSRLKPSDPSSVYEAQTGGWPGGLDDAAVDTVCRLFELHGFTVQRKEAEPCQ